MISVMVYLWMSRGVKLRVKLFGFCGTVLLVTILNACASAIPGGDSLYCMSSKYSQEFHATVEWANYDYGRFREVGFGGNSSICAFVKFHTLTVRWQTKAGINREEVVDIAPLIDSLKKKQRKVGPFPNAIVTKIRISINDKTLILTYHLYDKNSRRYHYPLYTSGQQEN